MVMEVCHGKIQLMKNGSQSLSNDPKQLKVLLLQKREQLNQLQTKLTVQQARLDQKSDYIKQLFESIQLARQQCFGSCIDE